MIHGNCSGNALTTATPSNSWKNIPTFGTPTEDMMPESIQAGEKNLDKVFCNDYLFEIPVFQRPYAWTTEEVNELLDDLLFSMDKDDQEPYFLGSVVLDKEENPRSLVVDGQQRLTTLTMLLCSLRELADEDVKSLIDGRIRQKFDPLTGAREVVRVEQRRQDQSFFYRYIQSEGGIQRLLESMPKTETDSQVRICENVRLVHQKLMELSPAERMKLASFIITQCLTVKLEPLDESGTWKNVPMDRDLFSKPAKGCALNSGVVIPVEVHEPVSNGMNRVFGSIHSTHIVGHASVGVQR